MNNCKVSIITPVFNGEKTIKKTIESVLSQTYKNIEYIIVDGGSTDSTVEIIKEYVLQYGKIIKYVSESDNGIYNAMNKGLRMSTGELIGIINSDDYYEYNAVESVLHHYDRTADYQVIYSYCNMINKYGHIYKVNKFSHADLSNGMIPHPTCFVTRKTYCKYGMFLEWLKTAADYELMLRFKRNNVSFIQIREVLASFSEGGVSTAKDNLLEKRIIKILYKI